MKLTELNIGQIVKSRSGRDKGRYFIVIARLDEEYVLLVDGSLRKLDKPKKKKIKHLDLLDRISNPVREALFNNIEINDAFIIEELKQIEK